MKRYKSCYAVLVLVKSNNSGVVLKGCKIGILLRFNVLVSCLFYKCLYINSLLQKGIKRCLSKPVY